MVTGVMRPLIPLERIERGRARARAEMVDTGRVTRPARAGDPGYGAPTMDPDTLQYTESGDRVIVYQGACRVQVRSDINSNAVEVVAGDREGTYRTSTAQFPMEPIEGELGHPGWIESDNELEILTSPLDPVRVGSVLNLQADTKSKTQASHRRFRAREVIA